MNKQMQIIRKTIVGLIDDSLTTYEWDDNMSGRCKDGPAEALRQIAWQVPDLFPPENRADYCSKKGIEFFKLLLEATSNQA